MQTINHRWIRISIYFLIALSSSFLFRLNLLRGIQSWKLSCVLSIYKSWLEALGPFVGAMIVNWIFRRKREMTFSGILSANYWLMLFLPILLMTIIGVVNNKYNNAHVYGLYMGIWIVVYGVLEETGWRGYLQDELKDYPPFWRYVIVGIFWYIWHLTFLGQTNILNEAIILSILILASFGIGIIANKTKSIAAAACFHIIGNISGLSLEIRQAITLKSRSMILIACVMLWILLIRNSKKLKASKKLL